MISDKINDIISMLIETTNSGNLDWFIKSKVSLVGVSKESIYNNERTLTAISEDGLSEFEIQVKYTIQNDKWVMESYCGLWIRNEDLPNNQMYIVSQTFPSIINLRNILNDKFCSDLNPSTEVIEIKLSEIHKGISLSSFRNGLLTKVFDGKGNN